MNYDIDSDELDSTAHTAKRWISRRLRSLLRYGLVAIALVAAFNFFAPFIGMPTWAPYMAFLPDVAAPTESRGVAVNATHILVLAASAAVATRL